MGLDFLDLPQWLTVSHTESACDYSVEAQCLSRPSGCPHCEGFSSFLIRHGTKRQRLKDSPVRGKRVTITLARQRYLCTLCERTSLQPLTGIDEKRNATRRLVNYIEEQSVLKPFLEVSHDVGLSEGTVKSIFLNHIATLEQTVRTETPRVLGIDGVYIKRRERLIITDLERHLVVDIAPSIKEYAVASTLCQLPNRAEVKIAVIDMSASLRRAVQSALPSAVIVVDRYHVQSLTNDAVDEVRIHLRKAVKRQAGQPVMCERALLRRRRDQLDAFDLAELERWLSKFPELRSAYEIKEAFCEIWHSSSSVTAQERYEGWVQHLKQAPERVIEAFLPLTNTVRNWRKEVFAYFDHRHTNGFTESANARVKEVQREGRGYRFETVRAKVVYGMRLKQNQRTAQGSAKPHDQRKGRR